MGDCSTQVPVRACRRPRALCSLPVLACLLAMLAAGAGAASGATFGKTSVGATTASDPANLKGASRYALPSAATVSKLSLYLQPTGTSGSETFEGLVYGESGGAPGPLLGTTAALTFKNTSSAGWYDLSFLTPLKLAAGSYWIGFISGGTSGVAAYRYDSAPGALDYNANSYTSGASNPFGAPTVLAQQISIYGSYTSNAPTEKPTNTTLPSIAGTAQNGQVLTANPGVWSEEPTSYGYEWQRCPAEAPCKGVPGANLQTYPVGPSDVGSTLRVAVTATNSLGSSEQALSGQTGVVSAAPATFGKTSVGATTASDPANLKGASRYALPSAATVSKLSLYLQPTGTSGSETFEGLVYGESGGAPGPLLGTTAALTFKNTSSAGWYDLSFLTPLKLAAGSYWIGFISGGTSGVAAYRYDSAPGALDYNANSYTSGASNPFGAPTVLAQQISIYGSYTSNAPTEKPTNTTLPSIAGTAQNGQVLTANPGVWSEEPTSYGYEWQRCPAEAPCKGVPGANLQTYPVGPSDVGSTLRVAVTATNSLGSSEQALSGQTGVVTAAVTTYYVSNKGEEATADGSMEKPWRTVNRVNAGASGSGGAFPAGSIILFEAGYKPATEGEYLKGNSGGTATAPITYSTYGEGKKADPGDIWVESHSFLTFQDLSLIGNAKAFANNSAGGEHSNNITIEDTEIKDWHVGIEVAYGNNWHLIGNLIEETADSGILTQTDAESVVGKEGNPPGEGWVVNYNTINRTGMIRNVCGTASNFCHEHGIYFRCRNSEAVGNTITNFSGSGISQRFGNDTLRANKISKGGEGGETGSQGISFYPYDRKESTSRWVENEISEVPVGLFADYYDTGSGDNYLKEHFIIDGNRFRNVEDPAHNETEMLGLIAEGRPEFVSEHVGNTFE